MRKTAAALALLACIAAAQEPAPKEQLYERGKAAFQKRRFEEAQRLFEQALPAFEEAGEEIPAAWVISWIGSCHLQMGEFEPALRKRQEALDRMRKIYGDRDDPNVSFSLNNVAIVLSRLGRADEALAHLKDALAMNQRLFDGDHPEIARSLANLEQALEDLGRSEDALVYAKQALEMRRRLYEGDHVQVARSLNNLAACLDVRGQSGEALPLHEEALMMRQRLFEGDHPQLALSLNNYGRCLRFLGRTAEALDYYEKSLAMRERLYPHPHPAVALALDNLGRCLRELGRPADALNYHERARAIRERLFEGAHPEVALSYSYMAGCIRDLGRPEEALPYYEKALAMRREVFADDNPDLSTSLGNLASCLVELGRIEEAEPLFRESLKMGRRLFEEDNPAVATYLENLALCLDRLGHSDEALPLVEASLEMYRRMYPEDHPRIAGLLNNLATTLGHVSRFEEAEEAQEQAVDMARKVHSAETHQWAANLAKLYVDDLGRPKDAVPLLTEAISQIEALREKARALEDRDRADYFRHLRTFGAYETMIRAQLALGRPDEALRYIERGRARNFMDLLEQSRFDPVAEVERRARMRKDTATLELLSKVAEAHEVSEEKISRLTHTMAVRRGHPDATREELRGLAAELSEARRQHQEALRERARLVRNILPLARPDPPEALQGSLSGEERMLVYSVTEKDAALVFVPPAGKEIQAFPLRWHGGKPVTEASLATAVDAHREAVVRREGAAATGARLFEALVPEELWKALEGAGRVYLVPHGPLHRLPFETLVVSKGRYWLDDGPAIVYGPSGSVLLWCKRRADEQWAQDLPYEMVALGDPVFSRDPGGDRVPPLKDIVLLERFDPLVPLPGTRREVLSIGETIEEKKAKLLLGEDATKAALFEFAPQARMLHLATHQQVDERDGGSFSRLALTLPEVATREDDGFLRLHELFEHWRDRLSGCRLVVLSACETQRGPLQKDEGIYAMPLGFLYAGCPSVIGSLWRVDDASTADLMSTFYKRLEAGKSKLEAFTEARRRVREEHPEPYFWAPFIFVGDPR